MLQKALSSYRFLTWILIAMVYGGSWLGLSNHDKDLLTGDASGYYQYLPALFIHSEIKDPRKSAFLRSKYFNDEPVIFTEKLPPNPTDKYIAEDRMVIKYTSGLAVLQAPFFALGHLSAWISGSPMDGYSPPYLWWVSLSKVFYALLGLWLLGLLLKDLFDEITASVTLILVALATQLFFFSSIHQSMSHPYLFALYAGLIRLTQQWYKGENPTKRNMLLVVGIGFCAGMITLVRPTEIICLFIPLLYGLGGMHSLRERAGFFKNRWPELLLSIAVFLLCALPQLVYWKYVTGEWVYYSYGNESFDFSSPEIWRGLFSYKNGWLVYSPVMLLALFGILVVVFGKGNKDNDFSISNWRFPLLLIVPIHIYITYSWWCWNYINGFGSRPMVQLGALLAIPLAVVVWWCLKNRLSTWVIVLLACLFTLLNVFQSWQFKEQILFSEDANEAYFWEIMGATELNKQDLLAFDTNTFHPDPEEFKEVRSIFYHGFEDSLDMQFVRDPRFEGDYAYALYNRTPYGRFTASIKANEAALQDGAWLKVSVMAWQQPGFRPTYEMAKMVVAVNRNDQTYNAQRVRINNKIGGAPWSLWGNKSEQWDEVSFLFQLKGLQQDDVIKVYCWNPYPHPVYLDNMEAWLMEKK
jgi:hypothetical protein